MTVLLGAAFAAVFIYKSQWVGAGAMILLTPAMAVIEWWGDARFPHRGEAHGIRIGYMVIVAVTAAVYASTTGDEFYKVVFPALIFVPAVQALGRAVGARREARSAA